jgi:hypothetical protein
MVSLDFFEVVFCDFFRGYVHKNEKGGQSMTVCLLLIVQS